MCLKLQQKLTEYRNYTLDIIDSLEVEEYDAVNEMLIKRQQIIDVINNLSYTIKEFGDVSNELQIPFLEQKLISLMSEKRNKVKEEINKMHQAQNANNIYNKRIYSEGKVFNKKI